MFRLLRSIVQQWRELEAQIEDVDKEIAGVARLDDACQRLLTVPGVGSSRRPLWSQRSETVAHFERAESSLRG